MGQTTYAVVRLTGKGEGYLNHMEAVREALEAVKLAQVECVPLAMWTYKGADLAVDLMDRDTIDKLEGMPGVTDLAMIRL